MHDPKTKNEPEKPRISGQSESVKNILQNHINIFIVSYEYYIQMSLLTQNETQE